MTRAARVVAAAAGLLAVPGVALACPICFGASDAPMAVGMNWGVLTLLGVTVVVLGAFATFFLRLVRHARAVGPAEAGSHTAAQTAGAGFRRPDHRGAAS